MKNEKESKRKKHEKKRNKNEGKNVVTFILTMLLTIIAFMKLLCSDRGKRLPRTGWLDATATNFSLPH